MGEFDIVLTAVLAGFFVLLVVTIALTLTTLTCFNFIRVLMKDDGLGVSAQEQGERILLSLGKIALIAIATGGGTFLFIGVLCFATVGGSLSGGGEEEIVSYYIGIFMPLLISTVGGYTLYRYLYSQYKSNQALILRIPTWFKLVKGERQE